MASAWDKIDELREKVAALEAELEDTRAIAASVGCRSCADDTGLGDLAGDAGLCASHVRELCGRNEDLEAEVERLRAGSKEALAVEDAAAIRQVLLGILERANAQPDPSEE